MTLEHARRKFKEGPNGEARWVALIGALVGIIMVVGMVYNTAAGLRKDLLSEIDSRVSSHMTVLEASLPGLGDDVKAQVRDNSIACAEFRAVFPELHEDVREVRGDVADIKRILLERDR